MLEILRFALKLSLATFVVGNLLDMGLRLELGTTLARLRDARFVILSLLCGFVLCPLLAFGLTRLMPLSPPYALGMILLGMAPCAPALPTLVERARGEIGDAAAFMLLSALVAVVYIPLVTPLVAGGLSADAWAIARPLLALQLLPLTIGLMLQGFAASVAARLQPIVKRVTATVTIVMLILIVFVYGKGFIGAAGSYAFATELLFFVLAIAATCAIGSRLPHAQLSALALGISTRNVGAAVATLLAVKVPDPRETVMLAIGIPLQAIASLLLVRWLTRRSFGRRPVAAAKSR